MKRLMIILTGAWAFAAAAQTADTPAPASTLQHAATTQSEAAQDTAKDRDAADAFCLRQTGSRIPMRADRRTGKKEGCVAAAGRAYTRDDLDRTGEIDLADALRKLDPAIR